MMAIYCIHSFFPLHQARLEGNDLPIMSVELTPQMRRYDNVVSSVPFQLFTCTASSSSVFYHNLQANPIPALRLLDCLYGWFSAPTRMTV
jgi:hypothetical protein